MPIRMLISGIRDVLLRPKGEMRSKTNSRLESDINLDEALSTRSGGIVLIGLLVEVALAILFPAHMPPRALAAYSSWLETWGPVIADSLVFSGVYGEIFFARHVRRGEEELRRRSNDEVAAAIKDAADANERAANAELETQKLKAQFAWRRLSPEAIDALTETLSKFAKMSVMITFMGNDPESNTFAQDLGTVFKNNGWHVGFTAATFASTTFGLIIAQPDAPENFDACGVARMAASNAKLEFLGGFIPNWFMGTGYGDALSVPRAQIYVGPKPMPSP